MNPLKEAIAEEFVFWELAWGNKFQGSAAKVAYWFNEMSEEGVTPDQFRRASAKLRKTSEWPPSPAEILAAISGKDQEALPHYYQEWKPLPMPKEPPITKEQKRQIIEGMKPGAREMFLTMMYGNENGKLPN